MRSQDLEGLEYDAATARLQLQQFWETLDQLSQIQNEFVELAQTNQQLKDNLRLVEAALADIQKLRQEYDSTLQDGHSKLAAAWEQLNQKVAQIELCLNEMSSRPQAEDALKFKESLLQELKPYNQELEQLKRFFDILAVNVRKNEAFHRDLHRDLRNISRIGIVAIVGLCLALLATWLILATRIV